MLRSYIIDVWLYTYTLWPDAIVSFRLPVSNPSVHSLITGSSSRIFVAVYDKGGQRVGTG